MPVCPKCNAELIKQEDRMWADAGIPPRILDGEDCLDHPPSCPLWKDKHCLMDKRTCERILEDCPPAVRRHSMPHVVSDGPGYTDQEKKQPEEQPWAEYECPNCHSGTVGLEEGKLICRGECGTVFTKEIK